MWPPKCWRANSSSHVCLSPFSRGEDRNHSFGTVNHLHIYFLRNGLEPSYSGVCSSHSVATTWQVTQPGGCRNVAWKELDANLVRSPSSDSFPPPLANLRYPKHLWLEVCGKLFVSLADYAPWENMKTPYNRVVHFLFLPWLSKPRTNWNLEKVFLGGLSHQL